MTRPRVVLIGLAACAAFALVAAIMVGVMRRPLRPVDAMAAGAVATLASLLVLFAGYMLSNNHRDIFFKRRSKRH
jgi:poly(3-hydroxybutyrate) depolymerase